MEDFLAGTMPTIWCDAYRRMTAQLPQLLTVTDGGYQYIFDLVATGSGSQAHDRVVVCWGRAHAPQGNRDADRMSGFIGSSASLDANTLRDKGHMMSHGTGGGLDINLYPQRRDLNQRRKSNPASYVYAAMEKYTREHQDIFYFNRLLYNDHTWIPRWIEFGLVKLDGSLWVEVFDN